MRISDWSSDVCSSDLQVVAVDPATAGPVEPEHSLPGADHDVGDLGRRVQRYDGAGVGLLLDGGGEPRDQPVVHRSCGHHPHRQGRFPVDERALGGSVPGCCEERSEEHTSELQSLMRISYAVFCLKKKKRIT